MELPRYPLLFNPNARGHKGRKALKFIMNNATRFALYATRSEQEAIDLASDFAAKGEPLVIAAGGDGTLNAVVQGLIGTKTALGVFPSGTMNVFARELGIPVPGFNNMPLDKALEVIDSGNIKKVDMFTVNQRPFIQMAGMGFDAAVIESTSPELKKKLGPLTYLISGVKLLGANPPKLTLTLPDGTTKEGVAILAGNGGLYGGQVKLFNKAENNDKLLDFLIFKENGYQLVSDTLAGIRGNIPEHSETMEYVQAKKVTITCEGEVPFQVDGDLAGRGSEFVFKRAKKRLRVAAPEVPHAMNFTELVKSIIPS